jgi:hypothetical protein
MQYNDILLKNSKSFHPIDNISDKAEIEEMTDYITKAYARHLVYDQFPNPDVIMKDANGDPVIETKKYVKPTQPKGSGGSGKVTQADKKQKEEIAYAQERYKKVKNGNGDYALSKDGKIRLINGKLVRIVKDPSLPNAPADEIPLTDSERAKYGF